MRIGILTGSGTYALPGIETAGEPELVETRFGAAPVTAGSFAGVAVNPAIPGVLRAGREGGATYAMEFGVRRF